MSEADGTDETGDATLEVVDRLAARFPTLPKDHIAEVVDEEHDRMNGARVRNFIPTLAEHAATERLRLEADPELVVGEPLNETLRRGEPATIDPVEHQHRIEPQSGPLLGTPAAADTAPQGPPRRAISFVHLGR